MTDQDRRDQAAASELLDSAPNAANAQADEAAVNTAMPQPETAAEPTPEVNAATVVAAEVVVPPAAVEAQVAAMSVAAGGEVGAETEAMAEAATPPAEVVAQVAPASVETETVAEAVMVEPAGGVADEQAVVEITAEGDLPPADEAHAEATTHPATDEQAVAAMVVEGDLSPADEAHAEAAATAHAETDEQAVAAMVAEGGSSPADEQTAGEETGASFTPVAESAPDRPRRLKDLESGMELEGRVTSIALYGIFVDVGVGRDGLVHISEMSDTRIDTPSDLVQIGNTVKVRVKSIDPDARRISLTMRSKERGERRNAGAGAGGGGGEGRGRRRSEVDKEALSTLKVGDTIDGTITGFAPFGAFADIGVGKDGLIHVSELAEGRVEKPEDAVQVGDRFTFKVLEIDPEGNRISLSLRRALRSQRMQQLEPGQVLDGTVSGLATFGAFVDIGVGRDGLVHISALSDHRVEKVEDVVKVGDKVTVKVLEVDSQSKRISLTMRLTEPDPAPAHEGDGEYEATAPVVPRTGPGSMARFTAAAAAAREGRGGERRDGRGERRDGRGERRQAQTSVESYSTADDPEEEFVGDATLEDLLSKFGGVSSRRDRKKGRDDEGEGDEEERNDRRQRDAIKRTLEQVGRDN